MPGRGSSNNRCARCRMYRPLCLCAHIPVFELKTKLMIVMHWREQKLTTNTAVVACLALPNSEIHIRGREDERLMTESLIGLDEHAVILGNRLAPIASLNGSLGKNGGLIRIS